MNTAIQKLEEIGQNTSLKHHDSLNSMLSELNIKPIELKRINTQDFVCALVPEDDEEE